MSKAMAINAWQAVELNDLSALSSQFNRYPMLSAEVEQQLAAAVSNDGDRNAAQQLVLAHMRYVISVVRGYLNYGLAAKDLVQEGTVGLMKAVRHFQPDKGVRLVSYAVHWIKAEIHEFILRNWRLVKVATTKAQRKLFFNLRKLKKNIGALTDSEKQDIATQLDVAPAEVATMEQRFAAAEESYDSAETFCESASRSTAANVLSYEGDNPETQVIQHDMQLKRLSKLQPALARLDSREQKIVSSRWLTDKKSTLKELSQQLHISLERVRQLEQEALKKLRHALAE